MIEKPAELEEAQWVLARCREFHCLPSALLAEDSGLLRLLTLEQMGTPPDEERS